MNQITDSSSFALLAEARALRQAMPCWMGCLPN
jgi:hypothetical protein